MNKKTINAVTSTLVEARVGAIEKDIGVVKDFTCPACHRSNDYLEVRDFPQEYKSMVYKERKYAFDLFCPSCFHPLRRIEFQVFADDVNG